MSFQREEKIIKDALFLFNDNLLYLNLQVVAKD